MRRPRRSVAGSAAFGERRLEVVGGEVVFGIAGIADDGDAVGERHVRLAGDLARHRDEVKRAIGRRRRQGESQKGGRKGGRAEGRMAIRYMRGRDVR